MRVLEVLDGRAEALGPLLFYSCLGVKGDCLKWGNPGPKFLSWRKSQGPILSTPYTQHELTGWGEKASTKRKIQNS